MADNAKIRLNKVLRELNISLDRAVDFLNGKGHDVEARPTTKISDDVYQVYLTSSRRIRVKKLHLRKLERKNVRKRRQFEFNWKKNRKIVAWPVSEEILKLKTKLWLVKLNWPDLKWLVKLT